MKKFVAPETSLAMAFRSALVGCIAILPILVISIPTGCSPRGFTKPRSQLIEESRAHGRHARSVQQERARFFGVQEENRRRLSSLVSSRARGDMSSDDYRLGPGDILEVSVFDVPELNVSAKVRDSGMIALPLIGAFSAQGETERSFQRKLENKLSEFVISPQAGVTVTEYGSQRVAVLGAVNEPGTYSLKRGRNSLLEVLGEAGGISEKAGNYLNFIPRESAQGRAQMGRTHPVQQMAGVRIRSGSPQPGSAQGTEVLLDDILGSSGSVPVHLPVFGGDMIIVPEAGKVLIEGEVERRGSYDLAQRMTLLGALASAGGITYGAKFDEIEIVRSVTPYERASLVMSLEDIMNGKEQDVPLRNGDIVRVPSDEGRRMRQDTFEGFTRLINVGAGASYNIAP